MKTLTLNKVQVISLYYHQDGISEEERILLSLAAWKAARKNNYHGWKAGDLDGTSINVENMEDNNITDLARLIF
jgi:hypothetical protein